MSDERRPNGRRQPETDPGRADKPTGPPRRPGPSLTRQAAALASGSLATQASALLLLIALTRLVPQAELGAYQQLGLIYGILAPLLVAGIPAALLYFVPRSDDPAVSRTWIGQAYLLLGAIGLAASVGVVVGRASIAEAIGNPALTDVLLPYAPYPFLVLVTAVMPTALVAVRRAGLAAGLNALSGALVFVGVLSRGGNRTGRDPHGGRPRRGPALRGAGLDLRGLSHGWHLPARWGHSHGGSARCSAMDSRWQ